MDGNPVDQFQRIAHGITSVLMFAQGYLHIQSETFVWDWELQPLDLYRGYAGRYDVPTQRMLFNGSPAWNTILHEAVHYWQHERGDDLTAGYARFALETKTRLAGAPEDEVAYAAYWNCPWEVEAREKAREMGVIYRNRMAGVGPHWS